MKLKLNTATFQNMVAKAVKGASVNGNFTMTQLMAIQLQDNLLTLITTDGSNSLYVKEDKVAGDDFYAVVPVEKFGKLISKLTCDEVTLEVIQSKKGQVDKLVIKGDGKYEIELPYDEDGELVEFPDPLAEDDGSDWPSNELNLSTVRLILNTAKAALLVGKEDVPYAGYYMGDRVVTSDSYKICGIDVKIFDEPKLLPASLVDLLEVISSEKIETRYNDDTIIFTTEKVDVYGKVKEGIEQFKIDAIGNLLDKKFKSYCTVDKTRLLQMLDRISLFVDTFDKNSVYLTFTRDGLEVSSKKDSGAETIPYRKSQNFKDYTCCLDIDLFKTQVRAYASDTIELYYGEDDIIKMVCGNTKQVVALADDDRFSEEEDEDEQE